MILKIGVNNGNTVGLNKHDGVRFINKAGFR